jgi:1,4-alpha-glucan branching enzyme
MTEKPKLVVDDPWLEPHCDAIARRMHQFSTTLAEIEKESQSLAAYASDHQSFGIHFHAASQPWTIREWAPAAQAVSLIGDFNQWNRESHPLRSIAGGDWQLELPAESLAHGQKVKLHIVGADGSRRDRIPASIRRAVQDPTITAGKSGTARSHTFGNIPSIPRAWAPL